MLRRYPILLILAVVFGCAKYQSKPLTSEAVEQALATPEISVLKVEARSLNHPILKPIEIDDRDGLSPDEAAVLAVLANPDLRAERDRRGLANAQLLDAKLLPDPVLSYSLDVPTGGLRRERLMLLVMEWDGMFRS